MLRTKWFVRLLSTVLTMIQQMSTQETKIKVYDAYGDEADMVHYGSTVEFQCKCTMSWCKKSVNMDLMLDGERINSTRDKYNEITKFSLRVDDRFKCGEYRCVMGEENWEPISLDYHLCADYDSICRRSDACDGKFCIVRKSGFHACSTPTRKECGVHRIAACNTHGKLDNNYCEAQAKNHQILMTSTNIHPDCGGDYAIAIRNEAGPIALGSTVYLTPETKLRIECGRKLRNVVIVEERDVDQPGPLWFKELRCDDYVPPDVHQVNRREHFKTKLSARTISNDDVTEKTYFYVVSLEKPMLNLSLPNGKECAPNAAIPYFFCSVENYEANQLKYLQVKMEILHIVIGNVNSTVGELSLHRIPVTAAGKYACRAEVVYRTCSPFSEHKVETVVEVQLHKSCLPMNIESEYVKVVEGKPMNKMILYAVIGGVSSIALVAVCIIGVSAYGRSSRSKREKLRQTELEKTLNESDPVNQGLILSGETLFKLSHYLMNPADNFKHAKDYVEKYLGSFDQEMAASQGRIIKIEGARYGDIPCYRHSQVRGMHVSRMTDWKLTPLFVAMAPMPPDFAKFWELILAEKIGTVVWIGDAKEGDEVRIDPYISTKQEVKNMYKNSGNLTVTVKTSSVKDVVESQYSAYAVDVAIKGSSDVPFVTKPRKVIIIHVRDWPDHNIPQGASAARLHQTCATIETFRDSQAKEHQTPGLLFHCSAGVQRSVAMVSLYIGRQIFIERKKVNLIGVMKYVRAARFGAFLLPARGFMQVPIVLGGLAALQASMQDEDLAEARPIAVTTDEKAVFNALNKKRTFLSKKFTPYRTGTSSKSTSAKLSIDKGLTGGGVNAEASTAPNSVQKSYDVFEVSGFKAGQTSTDGRAPNKVFAPGKRKHSQGIAVADTDAGSRAVFRSPSQPLS